MEFLSCNVLIAVCVVKELKCCFQGKTLAFNKACICALYDIKKEGKIRCARAFSACMFHFETADWRLLDLLLLCYMQSVYYTRRLS